MYDISNVGVNEAQAFPALGVNGEDRMHKQPDIAVADGAEGALAPALRLDS